LLPAGHTALLGLDGGIMGFKRISTMVAALFLCVSMSYAQGTSDATEQRLKALEEKIIELEGEWLIPSPY